jgi:diguanylate cyclase (GGDEF)-like protein
MELYAPTPELDAFEAALAERSGPARLAPLAALAWHLRQRDTARAGRLAGEAQRLADESAAADALLRARVALTRAECALLEARLDEAEALTDTALGLFRSRADPAGIGDCALLQARISEGRGERERELPRYREALEAYRASGDRTRLGHARAASILANSFGDPAAMAAEVALIRSEVGGHSRAIESHLRLIEGFIAFQRGAFLEAVPALTAAASGAQECGLIEQQFRAEAGLVSAFSNLGDREASCAAAEKLLNRARELGWPRAIGHALANFGRQLADTGHPERAVELLLEARSVLADQPRARGFAIACYYLGDAYLALGRNAEALVDLERAEQLMRDLGAHPEVACLLAIEAQALSRLDRPVEALERAEAGLALAKQTRSRLWEVEALRSLAEIHATHRQAPGGANDESAALRFLDQALGVVESIGGHHEKSQLYTEIARAHEATGDVAKALAAERAARAEEVREQNRRAANRLLLARERHETERQRVEAELQRSLAAAESERARTLEAALGTLEHLRQVGQDVTANLEPEAMLRTLERHLKQLADVTFIGVFAFDAAGAKLARYGIEDGRTLPVVDVALADFESYAARAARERREICVEAEEGARAAARIPGTQATRTFWFAPLLVGDQLLGVLTVQTTTFGAYGEREKLIFRTIAGYTAVAFANARTHGELEEKHRRLIDTEAEMRRLATTDPLTGLANRRRFFASAESEVARAIRYGGAIGVIMADLDRFKSINDAGGHGAGDRLIAEVAGVLRAQARPHDVIGRLGGEEFAFVLPAADLEATTRVADRIRLAVEALEVEFAGKRFRATISLGCSAVVDAQTLAGSSAAELETLIREADAALYEAKRLGRNRVHAAPSPFRQRHEAR